MQPKIQEVTLPDDLVETSPHPSLLPPAINPEVHPMVNRLRPVLSTEDAASEVVGTIRHSQREGHSKVIPSVTKILKVVSGSVILECFQSRTSQLILVLVQKDEPAKFILEILTFHIICFCYFRRLCLPSKEPFCKLGKIGWWLKWVGLPSRR